MNRWTGTRSTIVAAALLAVAATNVIGASPSGAAGPTRSEPLLAGAELRVQVTGRGGVPSSAVAATLNVTVAAPESDGYLTVYPCGEPAPVASNLNFRRGEVAVPNAVLARIGTGGQVCLTSSATTSVVVDLAGYVPTGSPITPLPNPRRLVDTRSGLGAPIGRTGPGVLTVQVAGREGVPTDARAAVVNLTVVDPSGPGFATVFPCDQPRPVASNLNFVAGEVRPNLVLTALDAQGRACVFTQTSAHVVVDAIASIAVGSGVQLLANPQRVADTRIGLNSLPQPVVAGSSLSVFSLGTVVPNTATAVVLNVTSTESTADGFVTVYPCGDLPTASNLNHAADQTIANLVVARLGNFQRVCLHSSAGTHLVVDVAGWFEGGSAHQVLAEPLRLWDSRAITDESPGIDTAAPCDVLVYPPTAGPVVVRDLRTGTEASYDGAFVASERPVVTRDCTGFLIAGSSVGLPQFSLGFGVWRRGFDGSYVHVGNAPDTTAGLPTLIDETADGRILATNGAGTWEVGSGARLWTPTGSSGRPVGAARDGSIGAYTSANLFDFRVFVHSLSTGALLRTTTLPMHGYDPKLSPDGTRFAVGTNPVGGAFPPTRTTPGVRALDGTLVASYPLGEVAEPMQMNWMSDTEVIVCVPGESPMIWTIGGGVVSTGAPPRTACPTGG